MEGRDSFSDKTTTKGGQMQGLLKEFRGVYESRLKRLDEAEKAGENTAKVSRTSTFLLQCHSFKSKAVDVGLHNLL